MTQDDWLKAKDPEAMLKRVAARLSPRQWHLLACAVARRVWEVLPEGDLRRTVEWCEQNAGQVHNHKSLPTWDTKLTAATELAPGLASAAQREIVRVADPDADPDSFQHGESRSTNPSVPLFQASARFAAMSVEEAGEAARIAAGVVAALLATEPGEEQLTGIRRLLIDATRMRTEASYHAASALKLKAAGDEAADLENRRNTNVRYSAAMERVTKEEESLATKIGELEEQKEKADRKALARFLQDIVGNPFTPFRFLPEWRTDTVVGLAKTIDELRVYDRMPILADALLDADCDEEEILRHCRGTEIHATEGPSHTRGCWVIDLILERESAYFAHAVLLPPPPPPPPKPEVKPAKPGGPMGLDKLLAALADTRLDDFDLDDLGDDLGEDDEDLDEPPPPKLPTPVKPKLPKTPKPKKN